MTMSSTVSSITMEAIASMVMLLTVLLIVIYRMWMTMETTRPE